MVINYENIYDISMPVYREMPVYKGREEKKPKLKVVADFTTGSIHESEITMNLHTGTHLDQPYHILPEGKTIDTLDISKVITPCRVLDLSDVRVKIGIRDLEKFNIRENEFILLKTRNSFEDILETEFIYLDKEAAQHLAEHNVKGVGIDSLGIERNQPGHETHLVLLNQDIPILEGLRLSEVEEGEYLLIAVPLNIRDAEAAPVRAILIK